MHYKDGTPPRIGDIVRGRGHNLPYEIVGPVSAISPSPASTVSPQDRVCAICVLVSVSVWHPHYHADGEPDVPEHFAFAQTSEYVDPRNFELVHRRGWSQQPSKDLVWMPLPPVDVFRNVS